MLGSSSGFLGISFTQVELAFDSKVSLLPLPCTYVYRDKTSLLFITKAIDLLQHVDKNGTSRVRDLKTRYSE